MSTPHKHAAVIRAWADGDPIEVLSGRAWLVTDNPSWSDRISYRAAPPIPKYRLFLWRDGKASPVRVMVVEEADDTREPREDWRGFIRWIGPWQDVQP